VPDEKKIWSGVSAMILRVQTITYNLTKHEQGESKKRLRKCTYFLGREHEKVWSISQVN
jgi:hypothetical protein